MLQLRARGPELWEEFLDGSLSASAVDRDPLLVRWRRAATQGAIADGDALPRGAPSSDVLTRRDRLAPLVAESGPVLARVATELASRGVVALLADRDGVIVRAWGGGGFGVEAARARLVEGASWAEGVRGTNAIGTALAEGTAVAVVGCAHYERTNHGLFCYAAPIRDAFGEVEGVLDITGIASADDPGLGVAVETAASAIEHALRLRAYGEVTPGGLTTLRRLLARSSAGALLVEAPGAVRMVNDAGSALVGAARADVEGAPVEDVLGASWATLASCARDGRALRFARHGGAPCDVELEPLVSADQRLLALMVYLVPSVSRAVRAPAPRVERAVATVPPAHPAFAAILGDDPALLAAKHAAARLAVTELPVLLLAETGTGKELFARAIHAASGRAAGPFVAVNCGAIQPSLLESELFGYAPGAFTGAGRSGAPGLVAAADGGTLFLDEIAELSESAQALLLRVLEDGAYHRVGDSRLRHASFRLLAATCRDLPARVADGRFRRDLFFRIHGASVTLPPLRARSDRTRLARGLLAELGAAARLTDDAVAYIEEHDWPGNVRELRMALAHGVALAPPGGPIGRDHLPAPVPGLAPVPRAVEAPAGSGPIVVDATATSTRDAALRDALRDALAASGGNLSEAARRLGVARSTVYRMIGRLGPARD
jgi:sigma-54 dependent transcriptional regulator, acetoin dehydrogenase operon transcriptional activator AcoR